MSLETQMEHKYCTQNKIDSNAAKPLSRQIREWGTSNLDHALRRIVLVSDPGFSKSLISSLSV